MKKTHTTFTVTTTICALFAAIAVFSYAVNNVSALTKPTEYHEIAKSQHKKSIKHQKLYVDPSKRNSTIPQKITMQPTATWLGGWTKDPKDTVKHITRAADAKRSIASFVLYNIPGRDCGSYSSGGVNSSTVYRSWIRSIKSGLGDRKAIVIVEPDALAQITCLDRPSREQRYQLLSYALRELSTSNASVYIDAGHSNWVSSDDMFARLEKAGVAYADGFSLNVSNFQTTRSNIVYGNRLTRKIGKHFVIDTSRNGAGANSQWCNPAGRKLGQLPTTDTTENVDAYLWIKNPAESDGQCNGGPSAGTIWPAYARALAS